MIAITFFNVPAQVIAELVSKGLLCPGDECVFDRETYDVFIAYYPQSHIEVSVDTDDECLFFNYISSSEKQAIKRQLKAYPHTIEYYF